MPIYDPKLLKEIDGKNLIAQAKAIGIKSPDKVSKEALVQAFMDQVEKVNAESPEKLTVPIATFYNEIVTILKLDGEPTPEEQPVVEEEITETTSDDAPNEEVVTEEVVTEEQPVVEEPTSPATPVKPVVKPPVKPVAPVKPTPVKPATTATKPTVPVKPVAPTKPTVATKPVPPVKPAAKEKPAPKEKPQKEPKPPKEKRYTRGQAYGEVVREMGEGTFEDLITKANQKYMEKGGADNMNESRFFGRFGESVLRGLGIVEISADGKSFKVII